jgi:hypothetical protein
MTEYISVLSSLLNGKDRTASTQKGAAAQEIRWSWRRVKMALKLKPECIRKQETNENVFQRSRI